MMLIAGTVPIKDFPLTLGEVRTEGDSLVVENQQFLCSQGTGALISAALAVTQYLNLDPPHILVAGDIGRGGGSRLIYDYLAKNLPKLSPNVLVMHYILPDMALMRKVCKAAQQCNKRPKMIADAASMYAAKAAGLATEFDMFTPDATEMAFLADPNATHPAYISEHLFNTDISQTPYLIETAYRLKSAPSMLLVKGEVDYIVRNGQVLDTITEPDVPALEAIGGTGDTITGIVSALVHAELELYEAAIIAAKANRTAGQFAQATPATRIHEIIKQFPSVFTEHLHTWNASCTANYENLQ